MSNGERTVVYVRGCGLSTGSMAGRLSNRAARGRGTKRECGSNVGGAGRDVRLEARALFVERQPRGHLVREPRPAFRRAAEGLGEAGPERFRFGLPHAALNLRVRALEADDVEGVGLAAPAGRGGRARLHEERGVAADAVTLGCVSRVADVQVAGEQYVRAAGGERLH